MYSKGIKRILDFIIGLIALPFIIVITLIMAPIIYINDKGPIFYNASRLGRNGKPFKMYKFRSMMVNAPDIRNKDGSTYNGDDDPRVTKVGRFMRKTSIDELPQLFNVFKGDISIVGPRPCVSYELGEYETLNKKYKKRFQVKGGITGLAQARGRNENSWDEKVTLDNQYIDEFKEKGIFLDVKIIIETIAKVFKKSDIYEEKVDGAKSSAESAEIAEKEIIRIAHLPDDGE